MDDADGENRRHFCGTVFARLNLYLLGDLEKPTHNFQTTVQQQNPIFNTNIHITKEFRG